MATSGTFDFTLDISDIIEEAYELAGSELRTGYDLRTARRSLNLLLLDWQNRGLNLWTIKNASQTLTAGTATYTLSSEIVDIIEALLRTNAGNQSSQTDLRMTRVSVSRYAAQTNKLTRGRPINYWIDRSPTAITVTLWPVPDAAATYSFNYYYMERLENADLPASDTIDVPDRHLPALTAGLAYKLALKMPAAAQRVPMLKAEYEELWTLASDSVREKASLYVAPYIGPI